MQPDSLVFLLIVGMWAAFFVQHWVRRREHLATVHAADAFTETMRVLDRRPAASTATPVRSSYAVPLSRTSRPQLQVRVPGESAMTTMARSTTGGAGASSYDEAEPVRPTRQVPDVDVRPASRGGTRIRQVVLVLAVLGVVATVALGYLGLLLWLWSGVAAGILLLSLAWMRRASRIEARRAARVTAQRRAAVRRVVREPATAVTVEDTEAAAPVAQTTASETTAPEATDATEAPAAASAEFVDPLEADTPAPAPVVEPEPEPEPVIEYDYKVLVDEDDIPLTWDPVPVPRPVYAMKAKAQRVEQAPAATTPTPEKHDEGTDGEVRRPRNHEATAYAGQPKRSAHTA